MRIVFYVVPCKTLQAQKQMAAPCPSFQTRLCEEAEVASVSAPGGSDEREWGSRHSHPRGRADASQSCPAGRAPGTLFTPGIAVPFRSVGPGGCGLASAGTVTLSGSSHGRNHSPKSLQLTQLGIPAVK